MPKKWFIVIFPVFIGLILTQSTFSQKDDLEKEFVKDVAEMEREYRRFEKSAFEEFRRDVRAMWGDFVASTKKDWVEYSGDMTVRRRVDFEKGEVQVEVLVPKKKVDQSPQELEKRLAEEIERLVVDRGKNRDYNLPTPDRIIPPSPLLPCPVLKGQLQDSLGRPVTEKNKREFARDIIKTRHVFKKRLKSKKGELVRARIKFSLVPDHLRIRAQVYLDPVRKHARRFGISVPLAFAVMHTESYFNPKATSPVPAYGLMQLVPESGGRDAYNYVYNEKKVLSSDYLYKPENNIELGCAYLGLLKNDYFEGIRLPGNALYCTVAAYNTGPGNLSRALCGKKNLLCAVNRANLMTKEALYLHLRTHLPYHETRDYLKKVTKRMSLYQEWI